VSVSGALEEALRRLARESGRTLADLGVRAGDGAWIRQHAGTVASLGGREARRSGPRKLWDRLARGLR
jgi:hypothetical protein